MKASKETWHMLIARIVSYIGFANATLITYFRSLGRKLGKRIAMSSCLRKPRLATSYCSTASLHCFICIRALGIVVHHITTSHGGTPLIPPQSSTCSCTPLCRLTSLSKRSGSLSSFQSFVFLPGYCKKIDLTPRISWLASTGRWMEALIVCFVLSLLWRRETTYSFNAPSPFLAGIILGFSGTTLCLSPPVLLLLKSSSLDLFSWKLWCVPAGTSGRLVMIQSSRTYSPP